MVSWMIPTFLSTSIARLQQFVDRRVHDVFPLVFTGLLLSMERRRTCTSWFRAAGITREFRRAYRVVCLTGRKAKPMGMSVLFNIVNSPAAEPRSRIRLALDDTPSPRYGPDVEGAGVHHNPTPGPTNQPFVYGHSFVTLAWLAEHPDWGTIALPVRAELYVRRQDLPKIEPERRPVFHTKLEQAADMIAWAAQLLKHTEQPLWLVVDGGYAKRPVLRAARQQGVQVVARLRKDAALRSLPGPQPPSKRGPKPIYGVDVISLAKRAGHRLGWQTEELVLYGRKATKTYKTFLATWPPAGGVIRVVLVKEADGWVAFFSTAPEATPAEILEMVADRNSLEQTFKDVKEVWGAGQQQLRNLHANLGAWNMNLWGYTLVELWAWEQPPEKLVDREQSPWDSQPRRPSHADRRKALLHSCLRDQLQHAQSGQNQLTELRQFAERLLRITR
jgi:hypothetical protein